MSPQDQLDLWVKGENVHNPDRDECCPDFSCCNSDVATHWSISDRKIFARVYAEGGSVAVEPLLLRGLGESIEAAASQRPGAIHIIGNTHHGNQIH